MSAVFLDTVGLIAIWDATDQWHAAAAVAYRELRKTKRRMVITEFVLMECGNAAARRPYRNRVNALRLDFLRKNLIVTPTADELAEAWRTYDTGIQNNAGIVDHVSFVVMRRLGINDVFTNDKHFRAAGFATLF